MCWEWNELSRSDEIWQTFYRHKFLRNNTVMGRCVCVFVYFLLLVSLHVYLIQTRTLMP